LGGDAHTRRVWRDDPARRGRKAQYDPHALRALAGWPGRWYAQPMSRPLDGFLAAAPRPQRAGLRVLLALAQRPRGAKLVARFPPVAQLACGLLAAERYEADAAARVLGWDAAAVVARGRALRRVEGRP
jgi:hypothetical protein